MTNLVVEEKDDVSQLLNVSLRKASKKTQSLSAMNSDGGNQSEAMLNDSSNVKESINFQRLTSPIDNNEENSKNQDILTIGQQDDIFNAWSTDHANLSLTEQILAKWKSLRAQHTELIAEHEEMKDILVQLKADNNETRQKFISLLDQF